MKPSVEYWEGIMMMAMMIMMIFGIIIMMAVETIKKDCTGRQGLLCEFWKG